MTKFAYKAKQGPGKIIDGVIEAQSMDVAISKIIQQGFSPIDVFPAGEEKIVKEEKLAARKGPAFASLRFFKRISLADRVLFTQQMSDLIDAAVPMLRALEIVAKQTQNPHFKELILQIQKSVEDGSSLSEALAQHKTLFPPLYINMVKAGEVSGQLEIVLNRLARYMEKEQETRNKVISSLAYPALVLVIGFVLVFVLLTFVIPQLTVMFDDLGQELPKPTAILIHVSSFFAKSWWVILALLVAGGLYFKQWASSPAGRIKFDTAKMRIPLLGKFIQVVEVGRFARTLGTLVGSGVAITTALNSVWSTMNNVVLQNDIKRVSEEVSNGSSLKASLQKCVFFPELALNMVSVGEETGHLDQALNKVADIYEKQSDAVAKTMLSLLGPIVLLVIVVIVGFMLVAMLLPVFQMNSLAQ